MGGGGGGGIPRSSIESLEKKAREKLNQSGKQVRHVFISFAHEDLADVNLFRGQAKNQNSALEFDDHSVHEPFNSENADYIKSRIREKIKRSSVTVVYLTNESAKSKWVEWEIQESIKQGKGVIGVYKGDTPPTNLPKSIKDNNIKTVKWEQKAITDAIEQASQKR